MRRAKIIASAVAAVSFSFGGLAHGVVTNTFTNTDANLTWNDLNNWSNLNIPVGTDVATFGSAAGAVTLDANQTAYSITDAATAAVTLNAGTPNTSTLTLLSTETGGATDPNMAVNVVTAAGGIPLTINAPIVLGNAASGTLQTAYFGNTGTGTTEADNLTLGGGGISQFAGSTWGVTFAGNQRIKIVTSGGTGITTFNYSGDTTINSGVTFEPSGSGQFTLPHGAGKGNLNLLGTASIRNQLSSSSAALVFNGLNGAATATITQAGGSGFPFVMGDGNANGTWAGNFSGTTINIIKIGSGTQTMSGANGVKQTLVLGGVLSATTIASGTTASGLGSDSGAAATGLFIDGGTVQFAGTVATQTTTDHLFTIGLAGGTLDASGAAGITWNATGAEVTADTSTRVGTVSTASADVTLDSVANLAIGMSIASRGGAAVLPAGTTIANIVGNTVTLSNTPLLNLPTTFTINATTPVVVNRTFTLSGSNTGANVFASVLANSTAGGVLSLNKAGPGNWLLTNTASTYTGNTTISGGTLEIASNAKIGPTPASITPTNITLNGGTLKTGTELASVSLTNAGTGYLSFPTVTVNGGPDAIAPTGVTAVANITGAKVGTAGAGYTSVPAITTLASQTGGTQAAAQAIMGVAPIAVATAGTGYSQATTTVAVDPPPAGGTQATATATVDPVTGAITGITITNIGSGYTSPPTVTINGGGSGDGTATAGAVTLTLAAVNVTTPGTGYTSSPNFAVAAAPTGGTNATVTLNGITITGLQFSGNPGFDFSSPTVTVTGGGTGATGATGTATGSTTNWAIDPNRGITVGPSGGGLYQTTGTSLTYAGTIAGVGSGILTKSGPGTLNLTAPNTWDGGTTVSGGTLNIASASNISTGPLQVSNPNTGVGANVVLNLNNTTQTVGSLSGAIATPSSGTNTAKLNLLGPTALTINQSGDGNFAGSITGPTSSITKNGTANLTLSGINTFSGNTTVNQGTLTLAATGSIANSPNVSVGVVAGTSATLSLGAPASGILNQTLGNVTINNGAMNFAPVPAAGHATTHTVLTVNSLSLGTAAQVDLSNNVLVVHNGNLNSIAASLKAGFNAGVGYWNGPTGIESSTASTGDTRFLTTIGYRQGNGTSSFEGTTPSATDVLVAYTYYGDADLNGQVNGADYAKLDTTFGTEQSSHTVISGWVNGDFNYDGVVDGADYALIDNTTNQLAALSLAQPLALTASSTNLIAAPSAVSAVPEPTTLGLLGLGAIGLLSRRRRNAAR